MLTNKVIEAFGMHINLCGKKGLKGNEKNTLIYPLDANTMCIKGFQIVDVSNHYCCCLSLGIVLHFNVY